MRRTDADTDRIFHAMLTHQIAAELTRTLLDERDTVAVVVPAENEPLALSWEPAPLVVWADPVVVPESEADAACAALDRVVGRARGPRRLTRLDPRSSRLSGVLRLRSKIGADSCTAGSRGRSRPFRSVRSGHHRPHPPREGDR